MAPPASVSAGCGELGSAKPPGPRISRQMNTSTCVTAPNSPELDASQDFLRGLVEDVVVILDEMATRLLGASDQRLQFLEGGSGRLLDDDMGASVERVHSQPEVRGRRRGDVDDVRSGLLQHGPVVGEPGPDAVPLRGSLCRGGREVANRGQFDARQGLQAGEVLSGDLPGSDKRCSHEAFSRIRR